MATARSLVASLALLAACGQRPVSSPALWQPPDETPPTVLARTPAPDASNVFVLDAIRVDFSEPVKAESVTDGTVLLNVGGALFAKRLQLSSDRRSLSLSFTSSPAVPATVEIQLTREITDDAGNPLTVPDDPWRFDLPAWQRPGGPAPLSDAPIQFPEGDDWWKHPFPSIVLDASGNPIVAWNEARTSGTSTLYQVVVKRWDGTSWQPVGGAVNDDTSRPCTRPWLAADTSGNLFIAWNELAAWQVDSSPVWTIFVKRWDGQSWAALGGALNGSEKDALTPSLAVDSQGNLALAWKEGASSILVRRYTNSSWSSAVENAAADMGDGDVEGPPHVLFDPNDEIVVSFRKRSLVRFGVGTLPVVSVRKRTRDEVDASRFEWSSVGGGTPSLSSVYARDPSLALDADGNAAVAWWESETENAASGKTLVRHLGADAWVDLGTAITSAAAGPTAACSLAFDPQGRPVLVYEAELSSARSLLETRTWDGTAWIALGGTLSFDEQSSAFAPRLVLNAGQPIVAFAQGERGVGPSSVVVARYNRF